MKIKFSQGELKRQRDALQQYERYLPTLQLKKQQLQLEISHLLDVLKEKTETLSGKEGSAEAWLWLLVEAPDIGSWLIPEKIAVTKKNIAGIDVPVFEYVDFEPAEYDLFLTPFWLDEGLAALREMVSLREEIKVVEQGISALRDELRITTQRVNLFEKVKIPETKEAIRIIKIYLGDQMTGAVGRSKIAKKKIEESRGKEVPV